MWGLKIPAPCILYWAREIYQLVVKGKNTYQYWKYFCFRKVTGQKVSNIPRYYPYSFLDLSPVRKYRKIMYALFQLKTCLRRIIYIYTTVIDATICSKPGYLPLFYLTVGCQVLLYVSRNARMQKKTWVLHRIINVSTLPFPSSIGVFTSNISKDCL